MRVITAPEPFESVIVTYGAREPMIFLAGSIEMGKAERWQDRMIDLLSDMRGTILNPRRAAWESSWEQSITNAPFRGQVEWELKGLDSSHRILFYFDPATYSPVSLLELGLYAKSPMRCIVCCPPGYWRKGNVDIVCQRHGVRCAPDLEGLSLVLHNDYPGALLTPQ